MFSFFLPASKVQKDRKIMRETDARLAKYSRRGLIFNFLAFLVILAPGRFFEHNLQAFVVLTCGLAIVTVLRGYFLFRFDHLYPRAPAKWRSRYFFATLLGASWWGVILVTVVIKLELSAEAPLLLIYTVIFFAITAHAFAPYQKFLSYYQLLGQVPAAGAAFYLGTLEGYLYGAMILGFYFSLTHQCRLISENYWERLEASYALARKTLSIEEEKRDTRANVKLNREFIELLHKDIEAFFEETKAINRTASSMESVRLENQLKLLHSNIMDFNGVLSKDLVLDEKIFNIRHEIQHIVAEYVDGAEENNIQIETSLSPTLPMRLKGDASRVAQIIRSLVSIVISEVENCVVLLEVEFLREYETAGELYVSITRTFQKNKSLFFSDALPESPKGTLSLVVSKALAEIMNGSIEFHDALNGEQQYRFNAKVELAERICQLDFHKDSFAGHNVLLVHSHPRVLDIKRQELNALGFNVFTETHYKRALQTLQNSYKFSNPIESIIFYVTSDIEAAASFCAAMQEVPELKNTVKVAAATRKQQEALRDKGFGEDTGFYFLDKPSGLFEFESVFYQIYSKLRDDGGAVSATPNTPKIGLLTPKKSDSAEILKKANTIGENISVLEVDKSVGRKIVEQELDMILIDCDAENNIADLVQQLRDIENEKNPEGFMPIIGLTRVKENLEDTAYELGLDDYVDLTHNPKKTLKGTLSYWATLLS